MERVSRSASPAPPFCLGRSPTHGLAAVWPQSSVSTLVGSGPTPGAFGVRCPSVWLNLCHFSSRTPSLAPRLSPPEAPDCTGGILNSRPRSQSPQPPHVSHVPRCPQTSSCFYSSCASPFSTPSHLAHRGNLTFSLCPVQRPHLRETFIPLLGLGFTSF